MLLDSGSQSKEVEYYNSFKQRADEACTWIISTIGFCEWLKDSNDGSSIPASKFCILFGDMGSGKSVTTGFVVDFLVSHPALSGSLKPFVCVYYCKNDNETNKARNIYRSILSQILTRMGQLKSIFMKWYKEAQTKNSLVDPTLDDNALRDFLVGVLRRFSRRLYLVLDGVDECDYDNRDHILHFFEKFHEHGAPVNVFLSCRYDESIKDRLPPGRRILRMKASLDRDHIIAAFHVNHLLSRQPEQIKELIIKELAEKAEGSAIWLKMVLEYLRRPHRSEGEIKRDLQRMPSPKSLSKLYRKLFETATCGNSEYAAKIECALETLAISGRLLTLDELAYAVTLRMEEKNISSLSDLEECMVGSTGLLELISPFVSIVGAAGSAIVRIVHQSLKDLIVREASADWGSHDSITPENMEQRQSRLHSSLLNCCTKYLLLDNLEEKDLFPEEKLEAMERQAYGEILIQVQLTTTTDSFERSGISRPLRHGR
jgi:Cdc6-like AAA superfamily ATPase